MQFKDEDLDKDISEVDTIEYIALYEAVELGNIEIVKLLLSNEKINVNIPCKKVHYYYAGLNGFYDDNNKENGKFRETYEYKMYDEMTPLYLAIKKQFIEIAKLLLSH